MSADPAAHKQALRRQLRVERSALPSTRRQAESATVAALVAELLQAHEHLPLASYLALPDELDLDALHRQWWARGRALWLPRVSGPGTLTWHALPGPEHTRPGSYGIREPDHARVPAAPLPPEATVLVPGLAFDRLGHRLGQGKGFYDRVLHSHRGHTIGVAFRCQLVDHVPTEAHDQRVAVVVAGGEVYIR